MLAIVIFSFTCRSTNIHFKNIPENNTNGNHVFVGISLFNPYYTHKEIFFKILEELGGKGVEQAYPFIPHTISIHTNCARRIRDSAKELTELTEEDLQEFTRKAKTRVEKDYRYLLKRIDKAKSANKENKAHTCQFNSFEYSEYESTDECKLGEKYIRSLYESSGGFKKIFHETVWNVFYGDDRTRTTQENAKVKMVLEEGQEFLFKELGFLCSIASILNADKITYCYHKDWPILERLLFGEFDEHLSNIEEFEESIESRKKLSFVQVDYLHPKKTLTDSDLNVFKSK